MARDSSTGSWFVVVGVVGIVSLLVGSLGYALFESGTFFEKERINQFVIEQQSTATEGRR